MKISNMGTKIIKKNNPCNPEDHNLSNLVPNIKFGPLEIKSILFQINISCTLYQLIMHFALSKVNILLSIIFVSRSVHSQKERGTCSLCLVHFDQHKRWWSIKIKIMKERKNHNLSQAPTSSSRAQGAPWTNYEY